jgi:amidase
MTQPHELDAVGQADSVREGDLGVVELVEHCLERIERLGEGAFLTVTAEQALDAAKRLQANGVPSHASLHGVPTAIKDLLPTAGVRTTFGSKAFADNVPERDAHVVTLLREAGMISLGKTNTPEFGLAPHTINDLGEPARNPWDTTRSAGGSSGGAARAVALGMVAAAHASDGGGSIRIPAGSCGLVGLKPTRGRVSNGPSARELNGLSVQGALVRTVRDAAAMLDLLAVPMSGDRYVAPAAGPFSLAVAREPGRLRIGWHTTPLAPSIEVQSDCVEAAERTARLLNSLGHDVEEIETPFDPVLAEHFVAAWSVQAAGAVLPDGSDEVLRTTTKVWRSVGERYSGVDLAAALDGMQAAAARSIAAVAEYDVVLTPTMARAPDTLDYFDEDADPLAALLRHSPYSTFTMPYNMTGQPAVSLPLHRNENSLPIGVQLAARHGDESTLLSLAAQLERARPWTSPRPPRW